MSLYKRKIEIYEEFMAFMASSSFELSFVVFLLFHGFSKAISYSLNSFQSIIDDGEASLVSNEGNFELGFFNTQGNPDHRFVGIWYKKIPIQTIVWVANRCDPIIGSTGVLAMNSTGNLVLLNHNKSVIWSTNSLRQAKRPVIELLDSGNLVLRDEYDRNSEENYLWQSFDYPSDTLLAGMKMGWDLRRGIKRRLSAWSNMDDPCPGDFTYGIEFDPKLHTYPEAYVRKGSSKFYRTGPWNGLRFSGSPELKPNPLYGFYFVYDEQEVYYMYDLKSASVVSRIVLNQTTSVRQRLTWVDSNQTWRPYSTVPRDQCDEYGICGANGNCVFGDNPVCHCLKGFKPKSQERWDLMDWNEGCIRNKPLTCLETKDKDGFARFSGLKLPDTTHSWVNKSMNLKECKLKCLSNCSCTAYANSNITGKGSGCVIWLDDLFDVREFSSGGQDLFIRMSNSELDRGEAKQRIIIIVSSIGGFSGIAVLSLLYCILKRRWFQDTVDKSELVLLERHEEEDLELPLFNLSTITKATDNFSLNNKLGEGGFGQVYRGELENGQEIAVKRLSITSGQGIAELKNEVRLIAKLQHRNLVKLLGCCIQGEEKSLIYEYMSNKSLDYFIFDRERRKLLQWSLRLKIISGIARGLLYLHQDSRLRVIHRDLKASNILLDNDMNPKISDFGLARTLGGDQTEDNTNRVLGTHGYIAPEYAFDGLFSTKSDVFSFGILVLEIISGKKSRGFHMENHLTLIGHAWTLHNEERSFQLVDECQRISDNNRREVLRCIHIGLLCVQQNSVDRPNMSSVVLMLNSEEKLPWPKPPGYFIDMDFGKVDHYSSSKPESYSTNEMSTSRLGAR